MLLRKRKTTTHHNEITADAPCQKAIEGQAKNPTSRRFHFFNVLLNVEMTNTLILHFIFLKFHVGPNV